jgi:hypothetical protein
MADHTPYQKKIIQRYYKNLDSIALAKLQELTGEIYLADGKKRDGLWKRVESSLRKLALPPSRIEHILAKRDPKLLAELVRELT